MVREGRTYGRFTGGFEKQIFWPVGFALVAGAPLRQIVDAHGAPFATEGDDITSVLQAGSWRGWSTCVGGHSIGVYFGGGG